MQDELPPLLIVVAAAAFFVHQFATTKKEGRLIRYFWLILVVTLCVQAYRVLTS